MSRLPDPGSDDGQWGDILNDYLKVTHNTDGTLKDGIISETKLASSVQTKLNSGGTPTIADGSITKAKLETAVQTTLDKADTALQTVTKTDVGLGNVDNTSDANKPVSSATQTALNAKYTKPGSGIPATDLDSATQTTISSVATHTAATTSVHGIADTSALALISPGGRKITVSATTPASPQTNDIWIDSSTVAGQPAWNPVVTWVSTTAYVAGPPADVVTYNGQTYIAVADSTNITPGTNGAKWKLLASGGQGLNFRGAWTTATAYVPLDVVTDGGQTYIATATFTSGASLSANAANWTLMAAKGADGGIQPSTVTTKGDLIAATASATVARLGVGSDGQMLLADSSQTTGLGWAAPRALRNYTRTGQNLYYGTPHTGTAAAAAVTPSQNDLRVTPIDIFKSCTIDRIGIEVVATQASQTVRLGIYSDDGNGFPGSLLLDAGTIDASQTTVREITISQNLTVGRYWLAYVVQGVAVAGLTLRGIGSSLITFPGTSMTTGGNNNIAFSQTSVSGALPSTFTTTYTPVTTAGHVLIRVT